jgi:ERF superfamily
METNVEQKNELLLVGDSPQGLIALAIQSGANIDYIEKLLALKERYDAAQANKAFLSAMSNFQKEVPAIQKKKVVGYTYAEIGEVDEAIKTPMADNGLSKRWEIAEDGERLICTCIISHIDGHTERTVMSSLKDSSGNKNEIQSRASAISYLQRYTLIGALGLTTASEDNDGDGTPEAVSTQQPQATQQDLPWLNIRTKDGEQTPHGLLICNEIAIGITSIEKLKQKYKMSKAVLEELSKIKIEEPSKNDVPIEKPDDKPFEIPSLWYARMDKCRTKADVLDVYNQYKETVDAHPEIQKLLKNTQTKLSNA